MILVGNGRSDCICQFCVALAINCMQQSWWSWGCGIILQVATELLHLVSSSETACRKYTHHCGSPSAFWTNFQKRTEQLQYNTIPQLYRSQYNTQYNRYNTILTISQYFLLYTALYWEILLKIELIVIWIWTIPEICASCAICVQSVSYTHLTLPTKRIV